METTLTAEQILIAAEDVFRRFGPTKATVVDVARTLGVSHSSVYRHFPSKTALREAVNQRWLDQANRELADIADDESQGGAAERLHRWLLTLFRTKRRKALEDPELFATFAVLTEENSAGIEEHIEILISQIARIFQDGVEAGEFKLAHIQTTARAVFDATAPFHDPAYAPDWSGPQAEGRFEAVWTLILDGLHTTG
ncbi:TetR family transcriptional regulator [Kitasatospora sp. NPDC051170]|uniref:TetR family transcriptional regulator n=1 Tax=Kitasatospora sp. NPDC051170 TaxID=3364056 RepID=UPI0037BAE100